MTGRYGKYIHTTKVGIDKRHLISEIRKEAAGVVEGLKNKLSDER